MTNGDRDYMREEGRKGKADHCIESWKRVRIEARNLAFGRGLRMFEWVKSLKNRKEKNRERDLKGRGRDQLEWRRKRESGEKITRALRSVGKKGEDKWRILTNSSHFLRTPRVYFGGERKGPNWCILCRTVDASTEQTKGGAEIGPFIRSSFRLIW